MNEKATKGRKFIAIGVLTAAGAYLAFAANSPAPSAHDCIAADRMPLPGCIEGEAARQRAEGRWLVDPGFIIWDGSVTALELQ